MAESNERKLPDQNDVIAECERLEAAIAELRNAYEQYFLGLDKRPPTDKHLALKKHLAKLKGTWVRGTAARFRVQAAAQKYATYDRLWQRTLQEIENGTHKRDVARAKRKQETDSKGAPNAPLTGVSAEEADALLSGLDDAKPAAAGRSAPAKAARSAPGEKNGSSPLSEDKLRAVYDAYVTAKKRCNEDVSKMNFDQVAQLLRKQVPELMKKHNARSVEFKVVIKDGKAILRAVPKDG